VPCSQCGEVLPNGAHFCLKCGKTIDPPAIVTPAKTPRSFLSGSGKARAKHTESRLAIWGVALALPLLVWWVAAGNGNIARQFREVASGAHAEAVAVKSFSVSGRSFSSYKFSVPDGAVNVSVGGQFKAAGGLDNDLQVYVLTDDALVTWRNGYAISPYYDSGKVSQASFHAALPPEAGTYYLVFSNNSSAKTSKTVQAEVSLHYNTLWPEWTFHLKDKLWGE
jgi:hypothetical protein